MRGLKRVSAFLLASIIVFTQFLPINSAYAAERVNVDLTLNKMAETVKSGDSALFDLDLKISGADENIQEEIGKDSKLTIQLPKDKNKYYKLGTDLEDLQIDGITPTYAEENGTLTYVFPEIKTGLSVRKYIALSTANGITPNGTELALSAKYEYNKETESIEDKDAISITAAVNAAIHKEVVKIVDDEKASVARPGYEVIYKLTGSVAKPALEAPGSLYLKEGSQVIVTDTFDSRLTYLASGESIDADNNLINVLQPTQDGQKLTWTFDAPTLDKQEEALDANAFVKEIYVKVKVSEAIAEDTIIPNKASIEATGLGEENSVTKESNEVKVPVLLPKGAEYQPGSIPIRRTLGPGFTNQNASQLNPNKGVDITGNVGFLDQYSPAAAGDEYVVKEGTSEAFDWNGAGVLKDGYKKIVAYYTPSDNLNLRSLHVMMPYAFKTVSPLTYKELPVNPSIVVDFTLDNGSTKQYTYDFSKDNKAFGPGQPPGQDLSFEALGLKRDDKVKSFTVTYYIDENTLIDGSFSEQVTARYDIMPGTEVGSRLSQKVEYVVTLKDGTVVRRGTPPAPGQYEGQTAERYDTLIALKEVPPTVEQLADFMVKNGNQVQAGKNRVMAILSNYGSASALYEYPESVVILPLGVKIDPNHTGTDSFYIRSQRSYTHNETIAPGEISVLSDDYNGTGHQAIIVKWKQEMLLPSNRLVAEFDVEIDKNAPDSLTMLGYGFAKTLTDKMLQRKPTSPIVSETEDVNGDGITGRDIATSKNIYVKRTDHDLKVEKLVKGSLDKEFSKFAYTKLGSEIQYKIKMTNTTGENIYKMGFMDILPNVTDIDVISNWSRGSAFTPTLKGAIKLPTEWEDKVDVFYSTEKNPLRSDVIYDKVDYPEGAEKHTDPADAVVATWLTADEVTDWSTIRSFKIQLKDGDVWVKGQNLELNFTMLAPNDSNADYVLKMNKGQSPAKLFPRDENETKAAWNSFAITTNGLLPTEPERVGVVVVDVKVPNNPPTPEDPTDPDKPTPEDPTDPDKPTPEDPTDPYKPTPEDPTNPDKPKPSDPTDPGKPSPNAPKNNTKKAPKTGDAFYEKMHIYTIICITSLIALICVAKKKRAK